MKSIYFIAMMTLFTWNSIAQRIIPYVPNGNEFILDDSFEDLKCYDGLVFQDSLFLATKYVDAPGQGAIKVFANGVLSDVPVDWDAAQGEVTDLLVFNDQLVAIGRRIDPALNQNVACIGIRNGGQWNYFSFPEHPRFNFGKVVNQRIYLFGGVSNEVVYFENGEFHLTDIVGVLDAESMNDELYFIKNDYSGMYHLDNNGLVQSDSILCDTLNAFSIIEGQLFVSARCENYLLRLGDDGVWVEDQLGIDFQGWKSRYLRNIFKTNRGFIAQFSNEYHNAFFLWHFSGTQSYEMQRNSDLNTTVVNVLEFEGREWAICYRSLEGANGGLSTIEDGWKFQKVANEDWSVTAYSGFTSYPYYSMDYFDEPLNIGFQYKRKLLIYHSAFQLFGLSSGNLLGVGGIFPPTLNGAFCGPLANAYDNEYMRKYNRVWVVKRTDIDYHLAHWWESNYEVPLDILQWPGNGNVENGESEILAPFDDYNNNNLYEPLLGETPHIKGDVASLSMASNGHGHALPYNDNAFMPNPNEIEMFIMQYVFLNHPSKAIANTVFTDYRINSKESQIWNDVYCGFYEDFDIGTNTDDFIGSDSTRNLIFGYNGDDFDQASSSSDGFGDAPPACGFRLLNRNMDAAIYFHNSTNPVLGEPQNAQNMYQVLQGNYINGSTIINPLTQQPTHFMYSGEIEEPEVWNETNVGNVPSDRRMVASTSLGNLIPNVPICITTATIAAQDSISAGSPANNSVFLMKLYSDTVQTFFDSYLQSDHCDQLVSVTESLRDHNSVQLFPNPSHDVVNIVSSDEGIESMDVYNVMGQMVLQVSNQGATKGYVNVQYLAEGIYTLRIRLSNHQINTINFMVD